MEPFFNACKRLGLGTRWCGKASTGFLHWYLIIILWWTSCICLCKRTWKMQGQTSLASSVLYRCIKTDIVFLFAQTTSYGWLDMVDSHAGAEQPTFERFHYRKCRSVWEASCVIYWWANREKFCPGVLRAQLFSGGCFVFYLPSPIFYFDLSLICFFSFFTHVNKDFPARSVSSFMEFCVWGEFTAFFFLYREKLVCSHYYILHRPVPSAHLLFGFDASACIFVCLHVGMGAKYFLCRGDRLLI